MPTRSRYGAQAVDHQIRLYPRGAQRGLRCAMWNLTARRSDRASGEAVASLLRRRCGMRILGLPSDGRQGSPASSSSRSSCSASSPPLRWSRRSGGWLESGDTVEPVRAVHERVRR